MKKIIVIASTSRTKELQTFVRDKKDISVFGFKSFDIYLNYYVKNSEPNPDLIIFSAKDLGSISRKKLYAFFSKNRNIKTIAHTEIPTYADVEKTTGIPTYSSPARELFKHFIPTIIRDLEHEAFGVIDIQVLKKYM